MQQHAASFVAHTDTSTGAEPPRFIKDEFDALLEWKVLTHDFLRLCCAECGLDKLLAFAARHRMLCPLHLRGGAGFARDSDTTRSWRSCVRIPRWR